MKPAIKTFISILSASSLLLLLGACSQEPASSDSASAPVAAPKGPPPTPVSVAKVIYQDVSEWGEFTGRLEAAKNVELRPRVSGYIEKVSFEEGALVQKGNLLFKIDARLFRAEVNRLNAELIRAQAQIGLAERDVQRAASLKQTNAISQEQVDNRNTQLVKAEAEAASVKAALRIAKLNLSFTQVRAPISGRISIAEITEGNYVTEGESVLTTLVSTDQVYAYFDVDELAYIRVAGLSSSESPSQKQSDHPVFMKLINEEGYLHEGKVDFIDNQIDTTTGTIRLRATFDNIEKQFTPGMFVRLKMRISETYAGILIDDRAVSTDLSHRFVLLLGAENKVEYRAVELGPRIGGLRVINSGLSADDVILVNGLQRARPGSTVAPTTVEMASEANRETLRQQQHTVDSIVLDQSPKSGHQQLTKSSADRVDQHPDQG